MIVWAKSDPWLELPNHLADVRDAAQTILTPARIAAFGRVGIGEQRAIELVGMTVWLHDFGKATSEWQSAILSGRRPPQHSLTSFIATLWGFGCSKAENAADDVLASALAVLAHHGQLSKGSFDRSHFRGQPVTIYGDAWRSLARDLPLKTERGKLPGGRIDAERLCGQVEAAKRIVPGRAKGTHFKGLYCLLLSLLVDADHAASAGHRPVPIHIAPPHVPGDLTAYQQQVRAHPTDILCSIAGCGSGKTAAALLRAAALAEEHKVDRIIFCLPTRFTSNSLLRDMSDGEKYAYPKAEVGLIHGEALSVLKSLVDDPDELDFPDTPEEAALRRLGIRYEHPITISTVDHLLMSLYHGYRFADRAFGNLMSSLVVFDEVHAYDATTMNAIREGLHVLQAHHIPTVVMSATLPSSRRTFLGMGNTNTVIEANNPFRPFRVMAESEPLTTTVEGRIEATEVAKKLLRNARGIKLAVYVNQVERAKALARAAKNELPGTAIYCYHSELAQVDRVNLETRIIEAFRKDEPVAMIATQAAELSIDISAERMVSEQAPADVIIQRAGRLHRRGNSSVNLVPSHRLPAGFVFQLILTPIDMSAAPNQLTFGALPYKDIELLERSWILTPWDEEFTFEIGMVWCEHALIDPPEHRDCGVRIASANDAVFGNKPQENFGEDGDNGVVTIRDIDESVSMVLPEIYLSQVGDTLQSLAPNLVPLRNRKFRLLKSAGFIERRHVLITIAQGVPNRERQVSYPVTVVLSNVTYDPELGGFDMNIKDETHPTFDHAALTTFY